MDFNFMKTLVENEFKKFLIDFKNSAQIFKNDEVKNGLLHAGEYGSFKESLCNSLLTYILPRKYKVGSGFIFNSNRETTGQCDVVVYNSINSPFQNKNTDNKFFPHEIVMGIGEIKSSLKKSELAKALIQLAKNKSIRVDYNKKSNCMDNPYNHIFSFLICDKIEGNLDNIHTYIQEEYEREAIEICCRHNVVLSLEDGLFSYQPNAYLTSECGYAKSWPINFYLENKGGKIESLESITIRGDEINLLKGWAIHLANFIKIAEKHELYPDPTSYLF